MCGEHKVPFRITVVDEGSSPHVRGALGPVALAPVARGIIPACAGSTPQARSWTPRRRDHPRMRGEHSPGRCRLAHFVGSSPHARGAPLARGHSGLARGIIPACAGSTKLDQVLASIGEDHPRMRGEHPSLGLYRR